MVRVFDTGVFETGEPYIVMELLAGEDLRSLILRRGTLMPTEIASLAIGACEALSEAHALGIVHRDLKPANLFVVTRADGSALLKVLDFGISKLQTDEAGMQTSASIALGSPRYMSPEQIRTPRDVDARCDVWAMGIVLYEALTKHAPFDAEGMVGLATAIVTERPPPLPQHVPFALANVVMRCLEKDRAKRFSSASELAFALRPFASPEAQLVADRVVRAAGAAPQSTPLRERSGPASIPPISGYEPTVARSGTVLKQRSHRIEILVSTAILILVTGAVVFALSIRDAKKNPAVVVATATASTQTVPDTAPSETIAPLETSSTPIAVTARAPRVTSRSNVAITPTPTAPAMTTQAPAVVTATATSRDPSAALRDRK